MPVVNGIVTILSPPLGCVVDFDNPQRQAVPDAYYAAAIGSFLSLLLMSQRLYTKAFLVGRLQWDDVFLVLAWFTSIATISFCTHMFATGAGGVHGWEISVEKYNVFMMDVFLAAAIYTLCGSFAKVSLLIFYFRLSPQGWLKRSVWITLGIIIGYTIGIFFSLIFACDPVVMSWDVTITAGTCINRPSLYIATAAANIISDAILFALPIPIVIKLQIPRKQKIGLFFIFAVGSMTVVTSIVRVSLLPAILKSMDQTWVISYASLWIIVEANLLVICAALPTLRRFFRDVVPKIIGESTYGKASKKSGTGSKAMSRLTIGGTNATRHCKEYSQFNDNNSSEAFSMSNIGPSRAVITGLKGEDVAWNGDDSSEKAIVHGNTIVQTTTITVEYGSTR
ncbi:hypothetical protein CCHL11_04418 [Colletotrichum chlorophyti]|uniref:Rhodopsin domain-containing protein n=1 Tax=Colletotrichum chlorophyti TaxID=708187 RepID=A0A1Q8S477_9PEZI|nr:hypothetical protein CCHL11_04418 [Colletotrichum chlorophyti]